MTSWSSFLHFPIPPFFFFFDMVTENYLCTPRFNPSHFRLCYVLAMSSDLTLLIFTHTQSSHFTHTSVRADGWRALSVTCWQLCVWAWPLAPCVARQLPGGDAFGPWLTRWVERGHFPASSVNVTTSDTAMPALPPVLVPAWWHVLLSQLACSWHTELPSSVICNRGYWLEGLHHPAEVQNCRREFQERMVSAAVLEQGEAGGGAGRVVETEKKNEILQQGGSGVVDLPHHSSQWPTHLFWHKYLLSSYVQAWRGHVPSHMWSSGFVAALWRVSLMFQCFVWRLKHLDF